METPHLSNAQAADRIAPWAPLFGDVALTAVNEARQTVERLGIPRGTERANLIHWAFREHIREVCDLPDVEGFIELREEPEGQGLDFLVMRNPLSQESPAFALRWGRLRGDGRIRRGDSIRHAAVVQEQLLFANFGPEDKEIGGLPWFTLGLFLDDDFTEAGHPAWWLSRITLVRERQDEPEHVCEVAVFQKPRVLSALKDLPAIEVVKSRDLERMERRAIEARKKIG
ncbi:MAG: hypothetical protein AMXMBFR47_08390 [Planctomycetota bacterium]